MSRSRSADADGCGHDLGVVGRACRCPAAGFELAGLVVAVIVIVIVIAVAAPRRHDAPRRCGAMRR
jgi:hypothetical protein